MTFQISLVQIQQRFRRVKSLLGYLWHSRRGGCCKMERVCVIRKGIIGIVVVVERKSGACINRKEIIRKGRERTASNIYFDVTTIMPECRCLQTHTTLPLGCAITSEQATHFLVCLLSTFFFLLSHTSLNYSQEMKILPLSLALVSSMASWACSAVPSQRAFTSSGSSSAASRLESGFSCGVSHDRRTDCGFIGLSKEDCERKGCCWDPTEAAGIPWCFHRDSRACQGYAVQNPVNGQRSYSAQLDLRGGCRIYGPDVPKLSLSVEYETDTRVHVKITDANKARFEVPESLFPRPKGSPDTDKESATYEVTVNEEMFSFKVVRKSDGEAIFDSTSPGGSTLMNPLIYEEQYMEISSRLPNDPNIFGYFLREGYDNINSLGRIGEVVHALRRDPYNTRQTMWARDSPTPKDQNIYGSHPFHIEMRNGKAHGVVCSRWTKTLILINGG